MNVSVIICTRNRAKDLEQTLESFSCILIPEALDAELVVVDNASEDDTANVVRTFRYPNMEVRYVNEPKPGKCNAYNAGMASARGEVLLFTDDDVRPDPDWVKRLATPLLRHECDAAVGLIRLPEHLERQWMTPMHKVFLAVLPVWENKELELIGANMGFRRSVLERVPAFDPELGPGALGFGDESLFSHQLCEAGYHLREVPDARVFHHLDPSRLLHHQWLNDSRKRGAGMAYLLHHWYHAELRNPRMHAYYFAAKLRLRRMLQPQVSMESEGCAAWEMSYLTSLEKYRQFLKERRRPRNYAKRGLARLDWKAQDLSTIGVTASFRKGGTIT